MTKKLEFKRLSIEAIEKAVTMAERYRLLNDPEQAESICHDILEIQPGNQRVLEILILSITDQFASPQRASSIQIAKSHVADLEDPYQRAYYSGIVAEREARALLRRGMAGSFSYGAFLEAMEWYEKAEALRPPGNDKSILRWNSCLRTIRSHDLRPRVQEGELPLE